MRFFAISTTVLLGLATSALANPVHRRDIGLYPRDNIEAGPTKVELEVKPTESEIEVDIGNGPMDSEIELEVKPTKSEVEVKPTG